MDDSDLYNAAFDQHRDGMNGAFSLLKTFFYINSILLASWGVTFKFVDLPSASVAIACAGLLVCGISATIPNTYSKYFYNNLKIAANLEQNMHGPAKEILRVMDDRIVKKKLNLTTVVLILVALVGFLWIALVVVSSR